jgi:hypothetical protein
MAAAPARPGADPPAGEQRDGGHPLMGSSAPWTAWMRCWPAAPPGYPQPAPAAERTDRAGHGSRARGPPNEGRDDHEIQQRAESDQGRTPSVPIQSAGRPASSSVDRAPGQNALTIGFFAVEVRGAMERRAGRECGSSGPSTSGTTGRGAAPAEEPCAGRQLTGGPTGERSLAPGPNGAPATVSDGSSLGWLWLERAVSSSSSMIRPRSTRISL